MGERNQHLKNLFFYFSMLLIVLAYLLFARYRPENGGTAQSVPLHWLVIVSLIIMPAWSYLQFNIGSVHYDAVRTQHVLTSLQSDVDRANAQGGEILFITQRHLLSMHMINNV